MSQPALPADALGQLAERCFPSPIRQTNQSVYLLLAHPTWEDYVALAFDTIDPESQDKIMACCFELQRRQLRMRVLVRNPEQPPAET